MGGVQPASVLEEQTLADVESGILVPTFMP